MDMVQFLNFNKFKKDRKNRNKKGNCGVGLFYRFVGPLLLRLVLRSCGSSATYFGLHYNTSCNFRLVFNALKATMNLNQMATSVR